MRGRSRGWGSVRGGTESGCRRQRRPHARQGKSCWGISPAADVLPPPCAFGVRPPLPIPALRCCTSKTARGSWGRARTRAALHTGKARGRWVLPGPGAAQPPWVPSSGGAGFWLCSAPLQKQPLGMGSPITSRGAWGRQSPRHRPCSCTPPPHPGAVPFPARAQLCFQPDVRPQDETALPAPAPAVALSGSRSGGWIRPRRLNKALPLSGSPRRASPYLAQPPCQDHEAAGRTRRAGRGCAGASRGR